jgi:nitrate/nitrite-specific signal transduction histidine kinase
MNRPMPPLLQLLAAALRRMEERRQEMGAVLAHQVVEKTRGGEHQLRTLGPGTASLQLSRLRWK